MPLFTILIAHVWLHDERITPTRFLGLVVGFGGVVILGSRDLGPEGLHGTVWGEAALLAATISYAIAAIFSRRHLQEEPPLVQSTMVVLVGDMLLWSSVGLAERPIHLPVAALPWVAMAWLGVLGSCVLAALLLPDPRVGGDASVARDLRLPRRRPLPRDHVPRRTSGLAPPARLAPRPRWHHYRQPPRGPRPRPRNGRGGVIEPGRQREWPVRSRPGLSSIPRGGASSNASGPD